eukprot:555071-Pleurochrysis_carterae.AAC.5
MRTCGALCAPLHKVRITARARGIWPTLPRLRCRPRAIAQAGLSPRARVRSPTAFVCIVHKGVLSRPAWMVALTVSR